MTVREIAKIILTTVIAIAATASAETDRWRAEPQDSSVLYLPSQIHFPVSSGGFSLTNWHDETDSPRTAVATYQTNGANPVVQIRLRHWDQPGPTSQWIVKHGTASIAAERNPAPGISEVTLHFGVQGITVDRPGTIIAGNQSNPSQLWVAFPHKDHVVLAIMAYAPGSLSNQEAVTRLGELLNRIRWSSRD